MSGQFFQSLNAALLRRRRPGSSNPLAAYTPSNGLAPYLVSDSVAGFYYSKAVGVIDAPTMFGGATGGIPGNLMPPTTAGFTFVQRGLYTAAVDAGDAQFINWFTNSSYLVRFGMYFAGGNNGRPYIRHFNGTGSQTVLFYDTAGYYAPATGAGYAFGGVVSPTRLQLCTEQVLRGEVVNTAGGPADFSGTEAQIDVGPDITDDNNRIVLAWEGDIGDTALQEMTLPFL